MLEEDKSAMEKKGPTRQSSVPPPKNGQSEKKNENKFPRNNRKRESNGSNRITADNGSRKPPPQKWRTTNDKRPRSRALNSYDRQREEVGGMYTDDGGPNYRTKKGNLNHLLNFSFAPREVDAYVGGNVRRTKTSGRVKFDKKLFLQANCQFIVKDTDDYIENAVDPDKLVDWDMVELVRLYSYETPSCPICLDYPVAAKVTRCGHVYCWSCILHLLSLESGTWAECPICYSPVLDKDLRSAETVVIKQYNVGDVITMNLMKRESGSTYSVPKNKWKRRDVKPHSIHDDPVLTRYMKLLIASPNDILNRVIEREKVSLETQLIDTEASEVCFIETALALLKEREADLYVRASVDRNITAHGLHRLKEELDENDDEGRLFERVKTLSIGSSTSLQSDDIPVVVTPGRYKTFSESSLSDINDESSYKEMNEGACGGIDIPGQPIVDAMQVYDQDQPDQKFIDVLEVYDQGEKTPQKPKNKQVFSSKNGYFSFQASDGQQIYVHNLNSRCLAHEYGCLEAAPKTITATIIDMKSMNMTEELRSRMKFLSHLPLSTEFIFVELDLKPPVLSRNTLDLFQNEIDQKRKSRQRKAKSELRREKKITIEENRKMGKYPEMKISLNSEHQFPSHITDTRRVEDVVVVDNVSPDTQTGVNSSDNDNTTVSFAQMLRNGPVKSPVPVWPKLSSNKIPSETPATTSATTPRDNDSSDHSDNEDYVPVPEYGQSIGNALKQALDNVVTTKPAKSSKKKGGKQKKKQMKLLFSTSMSRAATD